MKALGILIFGLVLSAGAIAQNVDAFHYVDSKIGPRDMLYSQMWYFNFIDDKNGIAGVIGGGVLDPHQRVLPVGQTSTIVAVLRNSADGDSFYSWSPHSDPKSPGNFFASSTFAPGDGFQFQNPSMSIKVLSPAQYEVRAIVTDEGRTTIMDLTYTRVQGPLGDAWVPWNNIQLPRLFGIIGGRATYTMQMPDAIVSGSVEVKEDNNDKKYVVDGARGYHDGYYGSGTLIPVFKWDWMSYQQDDLAIQMIDPHGPIYQCAKSRGICTPGNLRVAVKNPNGKNPDAEADVVVFDKSQIQLHYDDMKIDSEYPQVPYPDRVTITATDFAGDKLNLHWNLESYLKVFYHPPKPMKDLPTYEMVALLEGVFYDSKTGHETPIHGRGWVDYSNNP